MEQSHSDPCVRDSWTRTQLQGRGGSRQRGCCGTWGCWVASPLAVLLFPVVLPLPVPLPCPPRSSVFQSLNSEGARVWALPFAVSPGTVPSGLRSCLLISHMALELVSESDRGFLSH